MQVIRMSGLIALFVFVSFSPVWADIPRAEFIKITETVLDRMDELQALFENGTSKMEARKVKSQLDAAMKKYDRYNKKESREQANILIEIGMAHFGFSSLVATDGAVGADMVQHKETAVDLFMKYKNRK